MPNKSQNIQTIRDCQKSLEKMVTVDVSRMLSKGSVSLWGCGVELCSPDVAQPFATVRNRSQVSARGSYGCAYGKFCKRGHFWSFPASYSFISRGRRGTSWHSNMFHDVSKVVLCGRRNTFATFSDDALHFSWQAQHFEDLRCHFVWQAQHFRRVVLRVFCELHCQRCAKWWQDANSGVTFCDRWWKSTEASHETSILRENVDFDAAKCEIWGSLARNACFDAPTCLVSSRWLLCCRRSVYGRSCKTLSKVSKQVVMPFCVAGVAFRDIPTCFMTYQKLFCVAGAILLRKKIHRIFPRRRSTLETSDVIFVWQAHHFRRAVLPMFSESLCQGCATWWHSPLHTLHFTLHLHTPHFTLYTLQSQFHTSHSTPYTTLTAPPSRHFTHHLYAPHFILYTIQSQSTLCTLHFTLSIFNFTLNTPHFPLFTPHSTLYTLHPTLATPHFTLHSSLHTLHSTLHTLHSTLHTLHFAPHTLHYTLCTLHATLHPLHFALYTPRFTPHTLHFTLSTLQSTLHTLHFTLTLHNLHYSPHFTRNTPHFTLNTPHFTLYTPPSTLHTLHFTLHTLHSTLHTLHSTLYTPHFTLHTPHFTLHTLHCTLHTPYSPLHNLSFTLRTPHSPLHTLSFALHTPHSPLHTPHFTLHTWFPHFTLHTLHSSLYTRHSTLYTPHFTLYTPHFTLHTPHFTLHTPHFTLHTLHSTFYTPHFTLHTPHSTLHTPHSTSTVDSAWPHICLHYLHYVICIRVCWFLLFLSVPSPWYSHDSCSTDSCLVMIVMIVTDSC